MTPSDDLHLLLCEHLVLRHGIPWLQVESAPPGGATEMHRALHKAEGEGRGALFGKPDVGQNAQREVNPRGP